MNYKKMKRNDGTVLSRKLGKQKTGMREGKFKAASVFSLVAQFVQ